MEAVNEINRRLMARDKATMWRPIPRIQCADGFSVSIQASEFTYCHPRQDAGPWSKFELGFPSQTDDLLMDYAEDPEKPTDTVYGYVPASVVEALIKSHGGIK